MCSNIPQPRIIIPRCLIKDHLGHTGDGCSYHVTCDAVDQLGNRVTLYNGRTQCIVSDEYKEEELFYQSSSNYNSSAEFTSISTDFIDNFFSQSAEGIQLEGFDFESSVQTCQIEETYLTNTETHDGSGQSVVLTHLKQYDNNNNTQFLTSANNSDAVDVLASELLAQLPDDIVYKALNSDVQNDFVTDNNALIEILTAEKQPSTEQPTIFFLEENSDYGHNLHCIDSETYQATNDEVDKYMDESLDHISLADCPPSRAKGKHSCSSCDETFTSLLKLRSHLRTRHNGKSAGKDSDSENFMCHKCNRKFSCHERWQSHSQAHADPDLECPRCAKVLGSRASLKAHKRIHDRKFSCEYCVRTYETDELLTSHTTKKHSTFLCDQCDFTCRTKVELNTHLKLHTVRDMCFDREPILSETFFKGDVLEEYEQNYEEEEEEVVVDDEDIDLLVVGTLEPEDLAHDIISLQQGDDFLPQFYTEEPCDEPECLPESFEIRKRTSDLDSAYKIVADIMQIEARNKQAKLKKKKKKLTRDCLECEKHFDRGSDYKRHAIEHVVQETLRSTEREADGSQVFECGLCEGGRFGRVDKLKAHLRHHLRLRLYQCTRCMKTFSDSSNYSKHKKVHGAAVYQCDTCKRKFNTRKMITQHMDYHETTQPLACQYCDKVCYFESTLKKHINVHHKTKGRGAFSCQNCDLKFATMKQKWDHQWCDHGIRKNVNDCATCGAKFRKYSELKRHLKDLH